MEFKELKKDLLKRAKSANACYGGYKMGLNATCREDLLKAITANWGWVMACSKIIDSTYLETHFTQEELIAAKIFTQGVHSISSGIAYACDSSTVEAYDNAYVEDCTGKSNKPSGYAIIKDYHAHKIYVKKGQFEIIEVE